jgi:hypothetical protein
VTSNGSGLVPRLVSGSQPISFNYHLPGFIFATRFLDIYREGQLNNLPPDQNAPWIVNASLDMLGMVPRGATLNIEILDVDNSTVASGSLQNITTMEDSITGSIAVDGEAYQLWWPNWAWNSEPLQFQDQRG